MKNKLIIIATTALLITSCAKNKMDDPLIVPPNFSEMPDLQNPEKTTPQSSENDIQELKELLLKNN